MQVQVSDRGPCRKALRIEFPAERVAAEYGRVLDEFTRRAQLPGFRPGRAPRYVVERRFGREILEAVRERLIPEGCREAIQQVGLDVVAILGVRDVALSPGQALSFVVEVDVPPEFSLPAYKGIELAGRSVEVSDEEVEQVVQSLRAQHATYEEVKDRGLQYGDVVELDYEGVCEGQPLEKLIPDLPSLAKGRSAWYQAVEGGFLPGFFEQLLGATAGTKKQVFVDFDVSAPPALVGKKAAYFVEVKALRKEVLPALDAEFFKLFGVDSDAALRARIREELRSVAERRERDRLKSELAQELLRRARFDVPESLVHREARDVIEEMVRETTGRGVPPEEIEAHAEEIYRSAVRHAGDRVKLRYLLHRIAEAEKVEVGEEELGAHLESLAARLGMEPARLRAELKERQALDTLREELRARKTLDFLLDQAHVRRAPGPANGAAAEGEKHERSAGSNPGSHGR